MALLFAVPTVHAHPLSCPRGHSFHCWWCRCRCCPLRSCWSRVPWVDLAAASGGPCVCMAASSASMAWILGHFAPAVLVLDLCHLLSAWSPGKPGIPMIQNLGWVALVGAHGIVPPPESCSMHEVSADACMQGWCSPLQLEQVGSLPLHCEHVRAQFLVYELEAKVVPGDPEPMVMTHRWIQHTQAFNPHMAARCGDESHLPCNCNCPTGA